MLPYLPVTPKAANNENKNNIYFLSCYFLEFYLFLRYLINIEVQMDSESSEVVHRIRDSSHCELGKYVNVLVLYTGGTIGMYGTEDGLYQTFFNFRY